MKAVKDYLVFNYFAIEVVYNVFGQPVEYHHVPAQTIRTNKSKTKFWFNEDWSLSRKTIQYDRWTPVPSDSNSKIFFFDGYFPSVQSTYTPPEYKGAIKSIVTDIAIKDFNENNIKNHFSVSTLITFFQGSNVPDEIKRQIVDDLKASYTGEQGNKVIVDFQNPEGKSAEVKNINSGDWDKAYIEIAKKVTDDIFISHQITSPMLFGVKTEGQLGGSTELETAYEIFKATYVKVKRDALESAFNNLFKGFEGVKQTVSFSDKQLFKPKVPDGLKEKIMTLNELRAEAGFPPVPNGDRMIGDPVSTQPVVQETEKKTLVEPVADVKSKKLTDEDYELVRDMGLHMDEFDLIEDLQEFKFSVEDDVAKYVLDNDIKNLTTKQLSDIINKDTGLKVGEGELKNILTKLNDTGILKVEIGESGQVKVTPNKVADLPDTGEVMVMFQYRKRPDVSGETLLPTSRGFCKKIIESNKLYSRSDIQSMSGLFGYDVFQYSGGFYYDSANDETSPICRHKFYPVKVKRKQKD